MAELHAEHRRGSVLQAVSNAMVALHKEQFGRGPIRARTDFAGPDTLVCVLEGALLPAERQMVGMDESHRVAENRLYLQSATRDQFIRAVEEIVLRKVRSFGSATDAGADTVMEIFVFEPRDRDGASDGAAG